MSVRKDIRDSAGTLVKGQPYHYKPSRDWDTIIGVSVIFAGLILVTIILGAL